MSTVQKSDTPFYYAVVYTAPPKDYVGTGFGETASMLVAMAATEPGYLGFETDFAAEDRTVAVCYWNSYGSLSHWTEKAKGWTAPGNPGLDDLLCTTGCLWPWLREEREVKWETAARSVA
ncbi:MAG: hypothetical protein HN377_06615 [Alphaproteobacteria bacterium]|jgi:hypothetical protein|nr:hypothetical protein [Alphaproteobacteria bacterium]MBT7944456.1 hypothetical protein [Alphaproteobacteria bacterium]